MMKLYPSFMMFIMILMTGLFMVMSSNNWFMTWMGLELSLLGFLPLISGTSISMEGMIKYFLIQASASVLFIMSFFSIYSPNISLTLFSISLMMKMGLAPFHQWVPSVVASLNWLSILILMTIQKISPLIMIMKQSTISNFMMWTTCSLSVLISGMLGFNQTNMRPLMAYSSIAHNGWTVTMTTFSSMMTLLYFMAYLVSITILIMIFNTINAHKINKLNNKLNENFILSISMMNMAGLPPFPIFMMKVMVLSFMINNIMLSMIMVSGSMMTAFFYLYYVVPSYSQPSSYETFI